ncbi:hypothetical protein DRB89_36260 [Streptomyces sp. ICC4]|nr:hypothetical protein DRB89_36260 [Streptomyces sp. ICC4]
MFSAAMLAQRLPWTDAPARALGLDALTREGVTRSLLAHLRRTRSGRPVRVTTPFGSFLVPLTPADSEALLARADEVGALEPAVGLTPGGHRYGLSPHAVPEGGMGAPGERSPALVARVVDEVIGARRGDGTLPWQVWHEGMARLARLVVLGEGAAEDTLLGEITSRAAAATDRLERETWGHALRRRLVPHLERPDPASPAGRLLAAPAGADRSTDRSTDRGPHRSSGADGVAGAVAHLLALVSEAASSTALQALALRTVDPAASPEEAVARALRLYPPVAAAVYRVRAPFAWEDLEIGAGTEILCAPGWSVLPGDPARPGAWPSPLCGAPGDCPATRFAALAAEEVVRAVTAAARPMLISPVLTARRLPATLDPRTLLLALGERAGRPGDGRVTVGMPAAAPVPARGCTPASYGALARASAERLESHADSLAACAETGGWSEDEAGERFRTVLLDHARRCVTAADGVRRAANRLSD